MTPTPPGASQENTPIQTIRSQRVRFEDFPLPPNENGSANYLGPRGTEVQTFRSAALGALLPIAAAEGIVRPLPVYIRFPSPCPQSPLPPPRTTQSLEVTRLFHRGEICEHRARRFSSEQEVEILLEQLGRVSTDGAAEILEKKDLCWRCKIRRKFEGVNRLWCCYGGHGDIGETGMQLEVREVWNNV